MNDLSEASLAPDSNGPIRKYKRPAARFFATALLFIISGLLCTFLIKVVISVANGESIATNLLADAPKIALVGGSIGAVGGIIAGIRGRVSIRHVAIILCGGFVGALIGAVGNDVLDSAAVFAAIDYFDPIIREPLTTFLNILDSPGAALGAIIGGFVVLCVVVIFLLTVFILEPGDTDNMTVKVYVYVYLPLFFLCCGLIVGALSSMVLGIILNTISVIPTDWLTGGILPPNLIPPVVYVLTEPVFSALMGVGIGVISCIGYFGALIGNATDKRVIRMVKNSWVFCAPIIALMGLVPERAGFVHGALLILLAAAYGGIFNRLLWSINLIAIHKLFWRNDREKVLALHDDFRWVPS